MGESSAKAPFFQSPFTAVNGNNILPQFNQETASPITSTFPDPHPKSLPQPTFVHPQASMRAHMQPQSPMNHSSQSPLHSQHQGPSQWPPPPFSFLPQPHAVNHSSTQTHHSPTSPIYPNPFGHTLSPVSVPTPVHSQSHSVPTSLASLLNEPGQNMYMSYPTPPHTQTMLAGGDQSMSFSPGHYFDGQGSVGWPLITMPPGQQS